MSEPSAATSSTPVAGETRATPAPARRRRSWDAAKWITLAIFVAGAGAGSMAAVASKADDAKVSAVEARVTAAEKKIERFDERFDWMLTALEGLTKQAGVAVPPPPKGEH